MPTVDGQQGGPSRGEDSGARLNWKALRSHFHPTVPDTRLPWIAEALPLHAGKVLQVEILWDLPSGSSCSWHRGPPTTTTTAVPLAGPGAPSPLSPEELPLPSVVHFLAAGPRPPLLPVPPTPGSLSIEAHQDGYDRVSFLLVPAAKDHPWLRQALTSGPPSRSPWRDAFALTSTASSSQTHRSHMGTGSVPRQPSSPCCRPTAALPSQLPRPPAREHRTLDTTTSQPRWLLCRREPSKLAAENQEPRSEALGGGGGGGERGFPPCTAPTGYQERGRRGFAPAAPTLGGRCLNLEKLPPPFPADG